MLTALLTMAGPLPPILPEIGAERPPWVFDADDESLLEAESSLEHALDTDLTSLLRRF